MPRSKTSNSAASRLVILTGLSGSGMSSATNAFEDLGYFCVDNLPLAILSTFGKLLLPNSESVRAIEKAAIVVDIRERQFLAHFPVEVEKLKRKNIEPFIVFFEASDEVLNRRFSETRRPHPADSGNGLRTAIKAERRALKKIRSGADLIIDTSDHTVHTLRRLIVATFGGREEQQSLGVQLLSFGHKFGSPRELDLMFDVRHLPNPYFEAGLRELTGKDAKVVKYLKSQKVVIETIDRFCSLLEYLLPFYMREGKSYLTVGIGCTGGKHRSVMVTNELRRRLRLSGYNVRAVHRDVGK